MLYKLNGIIAGLLLTQIAIAQETLNLTVNSNDFPPIKIEGEEKLYRPSLTNQFTITGYRQAVSERLRSLGYGDQNGLSDFWQSIQSKEMKVEQEITYLAPVFKDAALLSLESNSSKSNTMAFRYEIDNQKLKALFAENVKSFVDYSVPTIYILPEITLENSLDWTDLGVNSKEDFVGAITESWKKWAIEKFSGYSNVNIILKDFTKSHPDMSNNSVIIKWSSYIRRPEVFSDRLSATYDITSQYVLVNAKTNQNLLAFDFPAQKKEYSTANKDELSSKLASLVYNLLNSQTSKISSAIEFNKASSTLHLTDFKVKGARGLVDMTLVTKALDRKFKAYALESELRLFNGEESVISIRSTANSESLAQVFSLENAPLDLNEQKVLQFDKETSSFAIIVKEIEAPVMETLSNE